MRRNGRNLPVTLKTVGLHRLDSSLAAIAMSGLQQAIFCAGALRKARSGPQGQFDRQIESGEGRRQLNSTIEQPVQDFCLNVDGLIRAGNDRSKA